MREQEHRTLALAAEYLAACIVDDDDRLDAAVIRLAPSALNCAVIELAKRAIAALADERGMSVDEAARALVAPP